MRLDQLHIQNFRCYEDATFDFQPGFNLVVGVNGSGKTSLLQAVAVALIDITNVSQGYFTPLEEELVRFTTNKFRKRARFEQCYPMQIEAKGEAFDVTAWSISKKHNDGASSSDRVLHQAMTQVKQSLSASDNSTDLPIAAFYRADRRWGQSGITAESAASQKVSRMHGYAGWADAAANLADFESWFIGQTLERLERIAEMSTDVNDAEDELTIVNNAIKKALPNAWGLRYDLNLRSLIVDLTPQKSLPFHNLSDGQRALIALVADIARRMCLLNPHMGDDVLINTAGIVIIDELDIHLHPAWQRIIASVLKQAFPKVQFIAASHSPQIIGSLKPGEVILLNNGDASHPRVTYGLDSSRVLEEVMGVSEREPEVETLLNELFSTIEDNDLDKAKGQLEALKEIAPDLPEFAGAHALIRRKEILGK
ncbi:AAA family ATPase [Pseudomonas sp. R76]|uniref:AAA family ATPase n=1 Tax=Pseudomonas sp. R76 TaxID=1573711 RepID=UPI001320428D|nr:AAA family ATPase [Pseudomonas sp. R76]QHD04642.1 ATP-binding protein [Pseudomonas sp. R76]